MSSGGMTRRDLLRRGTAASIAVGGVGYGSLRIPNGPVQNGQAIAPLIIAAGVGGSVALGWALREYEVVGSNPPAEGLTPDVLKNDVATTVKTRKSTNASTIIDNGNILDGVKNTGYADAKIAAIEKLNQQETETNVLAAANAAIDDYESTILGNFLKTWNESVNELLSLVSAVKNHPDIGVSNVFDNSGGTFDSRSSPYDYEMNNTIDITATEKTYTTYGGTDITYQPLNMEVDGGYMNGTYTISWDPFNGWGVPFDGTEMISVNIGNGRIDYLKRPDWSSMRGQIESVFTDVRNNISTWVSGVYGEVQSGEIDTSEILSPREQARIASEEEGTPQALADLQALNIATDLDREAEIYILA